MTLSIILFSADVLTSVLIALAITVFAALIGLIVLGSRKSSRPRQTPDQGAEAATAELPTSEEGPDTTALEAEDDGWTPPEPVAYPARVVDMRVVIGNVGGHKRPKTGTSFLVTFLTDEGERVEYPVPEELYVTLSVDQTGTLVILNEGFFDFGDGEDAE